MPIICENIGVAYFNIPKCASTSLKSYFYEIKTGQPRPSVLDVKNRERYIRYMASPFEKINWQDYEGYDKIAVVRHPVRRIVSFYNDKIVRRKHVQNKIGKIKVKAALKAHNLPIVPDFDTFVNHFDKYRFASWVVRGHTYPLSYFLGTDPSIFTTIYGMHELHLLHQFILSRGGSQGVEFYHKNSVKMNEKRRLRLEDVTASTRARLCARYAEDLEIFGQYFETDTEQLISPKGG